MGCDTCLSLSPPPFCFPRSDSRGRRLPPPPTPTLQWEHSKEQTIRHSLVGWGWGGSGPSSLHLPLLKLVLSSLPAQPGGAQEAGTPGHARSGLVVVRMATVQAWLCVPFPELCSVSPGLSSCRGSVSVPHQPLWLSCLWVLCLGAESTGPDCPALSHRSFCSWTKGLATQHQAELALCSSLSGSGSPFSLPSALSAPTPCPS